MNPNLLIDHICSLYVLVVDLSCEEFDSIKVKRCLILASKLLNGKDLKDPWGHVHMIPNRIGANIRYHIS